MLGKFLFLVTLTGLSLFSPMTYAGTEVAPRAGEGVISDPEYQGKGFLALSAFDNYKSGDTENATILKGIHFVMLDRASSICKVMGKSSAVSYQVAERKDKEELWLINDDIARFEAVKDSYFWDGLTHPHKTFISVTCR